MLVKTTTANVNEVSLPTQFGNEITILSKELLMKTFRLECNQHTLENIITADKMCNIIASFPYKQEAVNISIHICKNYQQHFSCTIPYATLGYIYTYEKKKILSS